MTKKHHVLKKTALSLVSVMTVFSNVVPTYAMNNKIEYSEKMTSENLALNKTVYTSSNEVDYLNGEKVVDGNTTDRNSRWASQYNNDEWITVDLGENKTFNKVVLTWESAYASQYKIQVSNDNTSFTDIATESGKEGVVTTTFKPVTARYVRMQGVTRSTGYGYSIYEFEVYNESNVDKTVLSQKLAEYRNFTTETGFLIKKLQAAVTKGDEVFNNAQATQEEVNAAVVELDRCYWLVKAADLYSSQSKLLSSSQDKWAAYPEYLSESVIPVVKLRLDIGIFFPQNEDQAFYENLYNQYTDAIAKLEKAPENPEEVMVGVAKYARENGTKEGGKFTIDEEWVKVNGQDKIKLTVTYENTGIHQITGKEKTKYTATELEKCGVTLQYQGGTKAIYPHQRQPLNGSYENGFVFTTEVDPGWYIVYITSGGSHASTLGKYYTSTTPKPKVDKSQLQKMYDQATKLKYDHVTNSPTIVKEFNAAMDKAKEVLESAQVTQEDVTAVTTELEKHYYILALEEYRYMYSPAKNYFDYNGYTTESVVPLYQAYKNTGNYTSDRTTEECKTYIQGFEDALKLLIEAPENPRGINIGINNAVKNKETNLSGQFVFTDSVVKNEDGTQTMVLRVEYKNDGINPLTGKASKKWSVSDLQKADLYLSYKKYSDGNSGTTKSMKQYIGNITDDGFIANIPLEYGPGQYTVRMEKDYSLKTCSHGVYYTNDNLVDKSELLAFYNDYAKDFNSDNWSFKTIKFDQVRTQAKEVLDNPAVTQDVVDNMLVKLKYKYYSVKVAELNTKYNPDSTELSDDVIHKEYTTESLVPVINMWGITHNRINNNYFESGETIGQMENWYKEYLNAEARLVETTDSDVMYGINREATGTGKYQGEFKVVSTTKELVGSEIKTKVVVEFHNTGKHPIYGTELPNANGSTQFTKYNLSPSTLNKISFNYYSYKDNGVSWTSRGTVKNLAYSNDGNGSSVITGEFYVDNDVQGVTFQFDGPSSQKETYSPWFYRFSFETETPKVEVSYSTTELTNQDVTVTLKFNEEVQDIEGWTSEDHRTFTKTFSNNAKETVIFKDLVGNTGNIEVNVSNIDRKAPEVAKIVPNTDGTITVKFSEVVARVEGGDWKLSDKESENDGKHWIGTLTENKIYNVKAYDLAGNKVEFNVDHEAPKANVVYSTTDPTTGDVKVTISFTNDSTVRLSNSSQNPGWKETSFASGIYEKTFTENTVEKVRFHDGMGNETTVEVNVSNIDRKAPEVAKIVPNTDGTITVKFSEVVARVEGGDWKLSDKENENDGKHWIGTLTENKIYNVKAYDLAGNKVEFNVDHEAPKANVVYSTTDPTTGDVKVTISFTNDSTVRLSNSSQNPGWKETSFASGIYEKTFTENTVEKVRFHDGMGNETTVEVNVSNIDRIAPEAEITYSTTEPTNKDVVATIKANEEVTLEGKGWVYNAETKCYEKVFTSNGEETVVLVDNAGNKTEVKVSVKNIDKKAPDAEVSYSTTEPTKEDVVATIKANEEVTLEGKGWVYNAETKCYEKVFTSNGEETVVLVDNAGNKTEVKVSVKNIDKEAPDAEVSYSTTEPTKEDVVATIKANEEVTLEGKGWVYNAETKCYEKVFTSNGEETVVLVDNAGNKTEVKVSVQNIEKDTAIITPDPEEKPNSDQSHKEEKPNDKTDTGVQTDDENNAMLFASLAGLTLIGGVIVGLNKKREE